MIEACLRIRQQTEVKSYYLLSGVLACSVLQNTPMIHQPEYLFQAFFSDEQFSVFRINNSVGNTKDSSGLNAEGFTNVNIHLEYLPEQNKLTDVAVCNATLSQKPLTASIQIDESNIQYFLEFPVKHINVNTSVQKWQIETGPVLMPSKTGLVSPESVLPAYVALNNKGDFDFATLETEKATKHKTRFYQRKPSLHVEAQLCEG